VSNITLCSVYKEAHLLSQTVLAALVVAYALSLAESLPCVRIYPRVLGLQVSKLYRRARALLKCPMFRLMGTGDRRFAVKQINVAPLLGPPDPNLLGRNLFRSTMVGRSRLRRF